MSFPLSFDGLFGPVGQPPFAKRVLHPWMQLGMTPIPDAAAAYAGLLERCTGPRLAYVHVPFCVNHCLFCGFYRNRANGQAMTEYVDAVIAEIRQDSLRQGVADVPVEAVYIGGGTPSALSPMDLARLLGTLRESLPLAPDCEITVEGRVFDFDSEKIDACIEAGANRFSIGIQSFDTTLRRRMGRKASREEAISFMGDLAQRGDAAVVCDLIYGLPGQTDRIWQDDVALCHEIGLDGVDLYCLTLQAGSPLALSIEKGALPEAASHEVALERYRQGGGMLEALGWKRLSQAHWGRTDGERNRYNSATKAGADCLAYGAGAGGLLAGHRFMQEAATGHFQDRTAQGEKPISGMLAPVRHHQVCTWLMAALEDGAVSLEALEHRVAPGFAAALSPLLQHWSGLDLLKIDAGCLTLSAAGRYWHNNLAATLFAQIITYLDGPEALARPPSAGHPGMPGRPGHPSNIPMGHPHERHPSR